MTQPVLINPFDPSFVADPHPFFARLRETAPVLPGTLPDGQAVWLVTGYAEVEAALADPRLIKEVARARPGDEPAWLRSRPAAIRCLGSNMLSRDPPDHTRLRRLVSRAFTPRTVEQLRPRIHTIADALLDAVAGRGEMDLVGEYAFPLTVTVLVELLGVPPADHDRFRGWVETLIAVVPPIIAGPEHIAAAEALLGYLEALFIERRREPTADLLTALVSAEDGGDALTKAELQGMVYLLMLAGYETSANLIASGTLALLQHPGQFARLRADSTLLSGAVEEMLRFCSPVLTSTPRYAAEDVVLGGAVIPKGAMVLVVLAAANRDPARFPSPNTFDITRTNNKHLAFGHGIHYCLGAALARLEGEIALGTLFGRLPALRLGVPPEALAWRPGLLLRGLARLPVAF